MPQPDLWDIIPTTYDPFTQYVLIPTPGIPMTNFENQCRMLVKSMSCMLAAVQGEPEDEARLKAAHRHISCCLDKTKPETFHRTSCLETSLDICGQSRVWECLAALENVPVHSPPHGGAFPRAMGSHLAYRPENWIGIWDLSSWTTWTVDGILFHMQYILKCAEVIYMPCPTVAYMFFLKGNG